MQGVDTERRVVRAVETDARRRRQLLTVVVIGGGLLGVELLGELTAFADDILRHYPRIRRDELHFNLFEAGGRRSAALGARRSATADRGVPT